MFFLLLVWPCCFMSIMSSMFVILACLSKSHRVCEEGEGQRIDLFNCASKDIQLKRDSWSKGPTV